MTPKVTLRGNSTAVTLPRILKVYSSSLLRIVTWMTAQHIKSSNGTDTRRPSAGDSGVMTSLTKETFDHIANTVADLPLCLVAK
jgi:hypothetical protein